MKGRLKGIGEGNPVCVCRYVCSGIGFRSRATVPAVSRGFSGLGLSSKVVSPPARASGCGGFLELGEESFDVAGRKRNALSILHSPENQISSLSAIHASVGERASWFRSRGGREDGPRRPAPSITTHSLTYPHSLSASVRSLSPSLSWPFSTFIALFGRRRAKDGDGTEEIGQSFLDAK